MCVNYAPLNTITKSMIYAPRLDRALRSEIQASTWYAKIDLKNAFYHLRIKEQDRWKTAFRLPQGVFEFLVLPFGLKNAPGEFQMYIEEVLSPVLGHNVTVHIDDVLIHCDTKRQCTALENEVRQILRDQGIQVNEEKSTHTALEVDYCGFRYVNGTCTPIGRVEAIRDWPTPRNVTELRTFLGSTVMFRDHIIGYAQKAQPLYSSTGKSWRWTTQQNRAFLDLKNAMSHIVTTSRYDSRKPSELIPDASLYAGSAILVQEGRVIAIWSRAYSPAERNYTTNERELLAVVDSLSTWQHLLEGSPLIHVKTDNMINSHVIKPSTRNRRINRWILILSQYELTWSHIPGITNPADAYSRRPDYKPRKGKKYKEGGEGRS